MDQRPLPETRRLRPVPFRPVHLPPVRHSLQKPDQSYPAAPRPQPSLLRPPDRRLPPLWQPGPRSQATDLPPGPEHPARGSEAQTPSRSTGLHSSPAGPPPRRAGGSDRPEARRCRKARSRLPSPRSCPVSSKSLLCRPAALPPRSVHTAHTYQSCPAGLSRSPARHLSPA